MRRGPRAATPFFPVFPISPVFPRHAFHTLVDTVHRPRAEGQQVLDPCTMATERVSQQGYHLHPYLLQMPTCGSSTEKDIPGSGPLAPSLTCLSHRFEDARGQAKPWGHSLSWRALCPL